MRRPFNLLTLLLLATALLAGCGAIEEKRSVIKLQDTLKAYEATVRWGSLRAAYDYLQPEVATANPMPDGLDNIRILSYEILTPAVSISETQVAQRVAIAYLFEDRQVQRTLTDDQIWERSGEGKGEVWHRANPIPDFK